MKYRLNVVPAVEVDLHSKRFLFESKVEVLAAQNTVADMLVFLQDKIKVMPDYSNMIFAEEKVDGEWEEIIED